MAGEVYIIGAFSTEFRKWPHKSFKDLSRDASLGVLADAALDGGASIDSVWFANSGMGAWGQTSVRGQVCLAPLQREGLLPAGIPIMNIENACAGGSAAAHAAYKDILSGESDLSLAIGVEKLYFPGVEKQKVLQGFTAGVDNFDPEGWQEDYRKLAQENGASFNPAACRSIFIDASAERARWHMRRYGTTARQIAAACSKTHWYGARNSKAQYQFEVPLETVLADRVVAAPLTRAMCAAPGDGAAAVLLCSGKMLRHLPDRVRKRAILLAAAVSGSGLFRAMGEGGLTASVAQKAYRIAGVHPSQIQLAELHDYTSFCEIEQAEALGFCDTGQGGAFAESGATGPGGKLPINTSGGLISKSHPVGATGLSMLNELVVQLRQQAGDRQVRRAEIALLQNCGGAISLDDAVCTVMILRIPKCATAPGWLASDD
jgi:acetyl-CoA acetyltransferase